MKGQSERDLELLSELYELHESKKTLEKKLKNLDLTIQKKEREYRARKANVRLSSLGFDSIIPYLNVNKRIMLSICYPSFSKSEKRSPIYFDELIISPSKLVINDRIYKVGEIEVFVNPEREDPKGYFRTRNSQGGNEWSSLEDDVLDSGDVLLNQQSYFPALEEQKIEKAIKLRQAFLSALETHLNGDSTFNPIDVFDRMVTDKHDRQREQLAMLSEEINGPNIKNILNVFNEGGFNCKEAEEPVVLAVIYPKAYKFMKSKLEEMTRLGDARWRAVRKLTYPPLTFQHFSQFSVFHSSNINCHLYSSRTPKDLSFRKAFKLITSTILGGRKRLRAQNFELKGDGIVPLPAGLKIDCGHVIINNRKGSERMLKAYDSLVRSVESITMPSIPEKGEMFNLPITANCDLLEINNVKSSAMRFELKFVTSKLVYLGVLGLSTEYFMGIIGSWSINRSEGSQLIIAFNRTSPQDIQQLFNSRPLRDFGFTKDERKQCLYLRLNENKRLELTIKEDKNHFSINFQKAVIFSNYVSLKVVATR